MSGKSITRVHKVKSLGLLIDEPLTWKDHVDETVKKISKAIGALKRVRTFISVKTGLQIYHALILPYFDYCSSVWGECSVTLCDKLQKLQNMAARVITRSGYDVSAKHLISLRQDNLTKHRKEIKATLMFKMFVTEVTRSRVQSLLKGPHSTVLHIKQKNIRISERKR